MTFRLTKKDMKKAVELLEEVPFSCEVFDTLRAIEAGMDLTGQEYVYIVGRDENKI